jgi:hypothetical protein
VFDDSYASGKKELRNVLIASEIVLGEAGKLSSALASWSGFGIGKHAEHGSVIK